MQPLLLLANYILQTDKLSSDIFYFLTFQEKYNTDELKLLHTSQAHEMWTVGYFEVYKNKFVF